MLARLWRRLRGGERRVRSSPTGSASPAPTGSTASCPCPSPTAIFVKQGRSIGRLVAARRRRALGRLPEAPLRAAAAARPAGAAVPWRELVAGVRGVGQPGAPAAPRASRCRALAAAGQFLLPGGRLQSFLAVEELTGMLPLHEAIPLASRRLSPADVRGVEARPDRRRWRRCAGRCTGGGYFHKDLYLCHFYVARPTAGASRRRGTGGW